MMNFIKENGPGNKLTCRAPRFKTRFLIFISVFAVVALLSCAGKGDWGSRIAWNDYDFSRLPDQKDYPDAGAILLLDEGKMEIFGSSSLDGFSVFEQHRIYKILNHRGLRYANVLVAYSSNSEVGKIFARTISPAGKITVLSAKNIYDTNLYPNFIFYSDQRAKIFTMPAVEDGSIIEYRYSVRVNSRTFRHLWMFQSEIPTLISRFTLVEPSSWEVNYRMYGIDLEPTVQEAPKGFKSTYHWETRHLAPLKYEFGMPPAREVAAHLALSPAGVKSWRDVAEWYHELAGPQMKGGSQVKKLVEEITSGAANDREKLDQIYTWVRDKIRYIAVEIGIGGFKPYPAEQVLKNHYGDCKDMSTLICSLGREAGLDVRTALVSTWQNGVPDTSLPSPLQFNHAIAFCPTVGDSGVWMDGTDKGCPFGALPWYDQGLPVLVVNDQGEGEIRMTPRMSAAENRLKIRWEVNLRPDGSARVKGKTVLLGAAATEMRRNFYNASHSEKKEWLQTYLATKCPGAVLDSSQFTGLNPVGNSLEIDYEFHSRTFAVKRSSDFVLRPSEILEMNLADQFRSAHRQYPVRMRFGVTRELVLSVKLPPGKPARPAAFADSLKGEFGTAFWKWKIKNNLLTARTQYRIFGKNILPEAYPEFRQFLDTIREKDLREILISPG